MKRTAAVATLGCKTNQFESASMTEQLQQAGYDVVPFEEGADLVVVNTCTVTAQTDSQSRNLIRRARRQNLDCRVIVTGCYAQVEPEVIRALPGVAVVIGNDEKEDLLRYLREEQEEQLVAVGEVGRRQTVPLTLSSFSDRSRAFVQIQNGCDAFCSYCIIPYARGSSRSVVPAAVRQQVEKLAGEGFPEVVLTGIHLGAYGLDRQPATSLFDLVHELVREVEISRLRLGSLEPTEISDDLIDLVVTSEKLCPHFHIPLQSGDSQVLKRMNRHYDSRFFASLVEKIASRVDDVAIGADVIAGFPGETDEEFDNCRRLLEELPITHLHVFPYSRRSGTPAARMAGQLPGDLIKERAAILRGIGEQKNRQFAERFIGRVLEVVVEGSKDGGNGRGLSRNYLNVEFPPSEQLRGKRAWVKVESWSPAGLRGRLF